MRNITRKTKRGQLEIMGLIVIVILLTLVMFFVLVFNANKQPSEVKKNYDNNQIASNFIISYLKTNTGCQKYTMENMIQDCAVEKRLNCQGLDSCTFVNEKLNLLLNRTLMYWERDFRMEIENLDTPIIFEMNCNNSFERESAFQPISLYPYPGTIIIRMDMCE